MSRYDYRDPGTDPAYCDPLAADPDDPTPRDGESWDQATERARYERLADGAALAILRSIGVFEIELARVSDAERAWDVRRRLGWLLGMLQATYETSIDKVDDFQRTR